MLERQTLSQYNFLVFNQIPYNAINGDKTDYTTALSAESSHLLMSGTFSSASGDEMSDDECSVLSEMDNSQGLSMILSNINIPRNPLSEIGNPSEEKLLIMTDSPHVGALTELRLNNKGLSQFESSSRLVLSRLSNLAILDLSFNYLTNISDLRTCTALSYLNISSNLIQDITPLEHLLKLTTLKACANQITSIEPLVHCEKLQKLHIGHNIISNLESTIVTLQSLTKLKYLTIFPNPCIVKVNGARERVMKSLTLVKIDQVIIQAKSPNPFQRATSYRKAGNAEAYKPEPLEEQITGLKKENNDLKSELSKVYKVLEKLKESAKIDFGF